MRTTFLTTVVSVLAIGMTATPAYAIVGGHDATTKQYPWMVVLSDGGDELSGQFCGGALVAPTKVVTAAHCIDDKKPADFQVIGGHTDLRTGKGTTRKVTTIWNAPRVPAPSPRPGEPKYLGGGDLSVITLDGPMPYRTLPIARAGDDRLYRPGKLATILGWGIYQEKNLVGPSPVLQHGRIPMRDHDTCNNAFKQHPALPSQLDRRFHVCGGFDRGGASVCGGDSGSPLLIDGRLAGVVSPIISRNGKVCEDAYSGYTRSTAYADLIEEQLKA